MYHIAAHLPEIFSDVKNSVQNVANVIAAQVAVAKDKNLAASLKTDIFANDPMRDDVSMPVGADPIMNMSEPKIIDNEEEDMHTFSQEEMDALVNDFFSKI